MFATKIKIATVVLLALGLIMGGAGAVSQWQAGAQGAPDAQPKPATTPRPPQGVPKQVSRDGKDAKTINGRVLGPDGRRVAKAAVFVWTSAVHKKGDLAVQAITGADGRFRLQVTRADLEREAKVVAAAPGLGPDWEDLAKRDKAGVNLRLTRDDVPIDGRVIDLEGQPVPGVTVEVLRVGKPADGDDLKPWIDRNVKLRSRHVWLNDGGLSVLPAMGVGARTTVMTGKDGRFQLTGFGRDRVLFLHIHGPATEDVRLWAATRRGPVKGWIQGHFGLFGASFTCVVGPAKPFVGTVRDRRTGKPLAGITVEASEGSGARTITNAKGQYVLLGVPKRTEGYSISVGSRKGLPYFGRTRTTPDTIGVQPITLDFEVERGIEITGRLTDKVTGEPVQGVIHYTHLPDNPNLKDFTTLTRVRVVVDRWGVTERDGTFSVLVIPGPALLFATTPRGDRYLPVDLKPWAELQRRVPWPVDTVHAIVRANPSEKDRKSRRCDIALEPGRSLAGTVVDPKGQPLTGVRVIGLSNAQTMDVMMTGPNTRGGFPTRPSQTMETADFKATGLDPRRPRAMLFYHAQKKLAKFVQVRGDRTDPVTVRLEPLGALAGRLLDAVGRPAAGLQVTVEPDYGQEKYRKFLGETVVAGLPRSWQALLTRQATTGKDGQFRVEGLIPGLPYLLRASEGDVKEFAPVSHQRDGLSVQSGKTKQLGDVRKKP